MSERALPTNVRAGNAPHGFRSGEDELEVMPGHDHRVDRRMIGAERPSLFRAQMKVEERGDVAPAVAIVLRAPSGRTILPTNRRNDVEKGALPCPS